MSAAHKSENPAATGFHATNQSTDSDDFTAQQKRLATVIAQMAMAGHQVHCLESGYLVSRWGMTKVCPDFASLVGFARQIGAAQ
jgi:hypothetical protein